MLLGVSLSFAFGLALAASGVHNIPAILPFAVLFDVAIIVALSCIARTNRSQRWHSQYRPSPRPRCPQLCTRILELSLAPGLHSSKACCCTVEILFGICGAGWHPQCHPAPNTEANVQA